MAKDVWKIALDELWMIPIVSNSPASQGVRVIKTNMGNIPERLWNSAVSDNPHIAHTETWYFKSWPTTRAGARSSDGPGRGGGRW